MAVGEFATPHPDVDPEVSDESVDEQLILNVLDGYRSEAQEARESGPNPRDDVWRDNWDRYWGRYDRTNKAAWQSKHVMPEVPQFVDRWAAAMREALTQAGRWYSAVDETGESNELQPHIERFMDVLLARAARTPDGHQTDFASVFEDQMKLGSLMACCLSVTWKDGLDGGWVAVESVDPREVWLDPKNRNLYRMRRYQIDKHQLLALANEIDDEGESLYNVDQIEQLAADLNEDRQTEKERSSGHGQGEGGTYRNPITIDEFLCTLVMPDGSTPAENALIVVANERYIIRGPEPNPFWHERDWIVFTPMVTVPFSVYGRSYAEDWADVADAFVEMTNLILDGVFTSTLKAFAARPGQLEDPTQIEEGIHPNVVFQLNEESQDPRNFLREIDLGTLPPESITVWQALKQEMREGAKLNEIALGQVPPKGDITATEVNQVQQSGSAMLRSMARTIEARLLEPMLTMVYQTALQHMDFTDERIARELGPETAQMLQRRKQEFRERRIKFRVRGLSALVDRQAKLRNLMSMLQVVGGNELLLREFIQRVDIGELINELFTLFNIDPKSFEIDQRERLLRQLLQQGNPGQEEQPRQGGSPPRERGNQSPFEGM